MKRKLSILVLLAVFSIVMILTGCGSKQSDSENTLDNKGQQASEGKKDIVIAGIYKMGDAVWFIEEGKASGNIV